MARLTPRYDADPIVTLDGPPADVREPTTRQRRRLAEVVAGFTDREWAHPSRCAGWSNRDVISHLDTTNQFWTTSITAGLGGHPTRFLDGFDPVSVPAQLVDASAAMPLAEVLDRFVESTDALIAALESLDDDGWRATAEAPPGHVSISALAHHALWDSWVHERDILLPLGVEPERHDDEIASSLRYAAALGPALASPTEPRRGSFAVAVTEPDLAAIVDIGDQISVRAGHAAGASFTLDGAAVDLVEALSVRTPFAHAVPADARWMLAGLVAAFDGEPE